MPAFFRLALTTVAVKSLLPNFPHSPLATSDHYTQLTIFYKTTRMQSGKLKKGRSLRPTPWGL